MTIFVYLAHVQFGDKITINVTINMLFAYVKILLTNS